MPFIKSILFQIQRENLKFTFSVQNCSELLEVKNWLGVNFYAQNTNLYVYLTLAMQTF